MAMKMDDETTTFTEPLTALTATEVADMSYSDVIERKDTVTARLKQISAPKPSAKKKSSQHMILYTPKSDTHWDYMLKEMMWLAADFASERKRQLAIGKKVAAAIKQFHKTKETRRIRELAEAELKRRRLAGKIGRDVRAWWNKIERVIAYKQKVDGDVERRKAMNKQLVALVRQTEKYGESLATTHYDDDDMSMDGTRHQLRIEEALAADDAPPTRRSLTTDYVRLDKEEEETDEFYGEATTSDSGSDGSFRLETYSSDDESTLLEAEARELAERRAREESDDDGNDDDASYYADPEELEKLQEEAEMDVNDVVERFRQEAAVLPEIEMPQQVSSEPVTSRRVRFAPSDGTTETTPLVTRQQRAQMAATDAGNEADDDGDASDVEDFVDQDGAISDGSGEFEADSDERDDETTIEAEERLGREMSTTDEIRLLQREGEMSIEELRKMYSTTDGGNTDDEEEEKQSDVSAEAATRTDPGDIGQESTVAALLDVDDKGEEDEFQPDAMEVDDETTMEAEERLGREMSHEQEMSLLQQDSEIPIDQLRAMYAEMANESDGSISEDEIHSRASVENDQSLRDMLEHGDSDEAGDEFHPDEDAEVDDETTMEAEERLGRDMSYQDEINLLKRESEMSVDELRQMYAGATGENDRPSVDESMFDDDDHESEDEFRPVDEAVDDETTIEAEERLGREISVEDEIELLQREGAAPIEDLRAMYKQMEEGQGEHASTDEEMSETYEGQQGRRGRKRSRPHSDDSGGDDGEAVLEALKVAEEKARMTRVTRPFLIAPWVKLREYQQIGLNWLVSIQTRRLNGILADEMGLGKTLQTIALLAYLAAYKGIWGPHLIIVPTSCIVNWETEFKRFAPGLKVLCYYGSAKRRKELRSGWTKANWHHVIVTSYQLVVQDSFAFKRKKWYYLILDEAHNIKNFESQRWQTLINFNTQRRLLLTGTPLQNNLMELWSLLHFLMPHIFRSRKEFSYWFSNPMNNIIEGNVGRSDDLISRLHGIIRPFVLRRLKKDVEKQMPGKFEHIVRCQLSRRQMFLYEEFMARSSTRQALRKGGNFMGMMNVLMQLRKVCNHPDLFEPRSVITPFVMDRLSLKSAGIVFGTTNGKSVAQSLSTPTVNPLWSCSSGVVDQHHYLNHDAIASEQLCRLEECMDIFAADISSQIDEPLPREDMDADLASLLIKIRDTACEVREAQITFQKKLSSTRCKAPAFPYSSRLINAVTVETSPFERDGPEIISGTKVISTPEQLLALRKSHQQRADDADDLMKKFVFCVPQVGAPRPILEVSVHEADPDADGDMQTLAEPLEEYFRPFRKARARLSSFFPDKKLVQFDAGKLQMLAKLLRELRQGGHRALIFTQMSKMLDVLEAFLNMNGLTYLRLDGSTGVDKRQRMMDRFNNDPRIFCFILSTRSGGLGINLTGADSVIFYDSDWNPAMDAQAQDRAHRIGQTRDVHIYRLITEHTIEENILIKAQQKRNLDLLVMDEGKFDASGPLDGKAKSDDVFSKGSLRSILGVDADEVPDDVKASNGASAESEPEVTKEQLEQTMASLEDEDDVRAMRGAQKEAVDELKEFDETIEYAKEEGDENGQDEKGKESDGNASTEIKGDTKTEAREEEKESVADMQREFEAWQSEVGMDASDIEASLSATERYALHFREEFDPFYSIFAINEYKRKMEAVESADEEIDLDEIERNKVIEERRALEEGDLLGTHPRPEDLLRQARLYAREKARLRSSKKRRKLTGENWETRLDANMNLPYWYNVDTGEAIWDKPTVLLELEAYDQALEKRWSALPLKPLIHVMEYLIPFPERTACSTVCRHWNAAATDVSFVIHVYPVEMDALLKSGRDFEHNHYRTIEEALSIAHPGDTIELGDGHYWVSEPGLKVSFPVRFVGDEQDASHVIVELSGTVQWSGKGGWMEGITFRRPRMASDQNREIIRLHDGGRVDMGVCILDNEGSHAPVAVITGEGSRGNWFNTDIKGSEAGDGAAIESGGYLNLQNCIIMNNQGGGISCIGDGSMIEMKDCLVQGNNGAGVRLTGKSKGQLVDCRFVRNVGGILDKDDGSSCYPCTGNVAVVSSKHKTVAGFRIENENEVNDQTEGVQSSSYLRT